MNKFRLVICTLLVGAAGLSMSACSTGTGALAGGATAAALGTGPAGVVGGAVVGGVIGHENEQRR